MRKSIAILLVLALSMAFATSCAQKSSYDTVATTASTSAPDTTKVDPEVDTTDYEMLVADLLRAAEDSPTAEDQFRVEAVEGGVAIVEYLGNAESICVPTTVGGLPLLSIAANAFGENNTIKTLVLPYSISSLSEGCLVGCNALVTLSVPFVGATPTEGKHFGYLFGALDHTEQVMKLPTTLLYVRVGGASSAISPYTFAECKDLVCVLLDEQIEEVGDLAFFNCTALKFVTLDSLTEIGTLALGNCRELVHVEFGEGLLSAGLGVLQGCSSISALTLPFVGGSATENTFLGYLFGADHPDFTAGYIPAYLRTVELLDCCTSLGDYAFFECSVLKSISLPQALTSIGVRAFEKCTALTSITLPASLKTVRENAFLGCTALESVIFSEGLQSLGTNVFFGCTALKDIRLPQSLKALPASAFANCKALEYVDFGGVEQVGEYAFHNCTALKNVVAENVVVTPLGNDPVSVLLGVQAE